MKNETKKVSSGFNKNEFRSGFSKLVQVVHRWIIGQKKQETLVEISLIPPSSEKEMDQEGPGGCGSVA